MSLTQYSVFRAKFALGLTVSLVPAAFRVTALASVAPVVTFVSTTVVWVAPTIRSLKFTITFAASATLMALFAGCDRVRPVPPCPPRS